MSPISLSVLSSCFLSGVSGEQKICGVGVAAAAIVDRPIVEHSRMELLHCVGRLHCFIAQVAHCIILLLCCTSSETSITR